jgi:hypothetical protein
MYSKVLGLPSTDQPEDRTQHQRSEHQRATEQLHQRKLFDVEHYTVLTKMILVSFATHIKKYSLYRYIKD